MPKEVDIIPDELFETYQPSTVQSAVDELIECHMTDDEKLALKEMSKSDLIKLHSSLGRFIRNNFFMWEGNIKLIEDTGKDHPDDASFVIIEALWDTINK